MEEKHEVGQNAGGKSAEQMELCAAGFNSSASVVSLIAIRSEDTHFQPATYSRFRHCHLVTKQASFKLSLLRPPGFRVRCVGDFIHSTSDMQEGHSDWCHPKNPKPCKFLCCVHKLTGGGAAANLGSHTVLTPQQRVEPR